MTENLHTEIFVKHLGEGNNMRTLLGSYPEMHLRTSIVNVFPKQLRRGISMSCSRPWQNYENSTKYDPGEDIFQRMKDGLLYDFRRAKRRYNEAKYDAFRRRHPIAHMKRHVIDNELLPFRADFVIIGGGLSGSSAAYWLKERFRDEDMTVVVIESTEHFSQSRSMLGTGIISQQFSNPEFVDMSIFSAEFIRHAGEHLKILDNDPPDINFLPVGFLHLARTQDEADRLKTNWKMQIEKGVRVAFYNLDELKAKYPFMNFDDVVAGTCGLENEEHHLGSAICEGEVEGMRFDRVKHTSQEHGFSETVEDADHIKHMNDKLKAVIVRPQMTGASARAVEFFCLINAAGPWSGEIAKMAKIGVGKGLLSVPLPIVCRRRTNYVIHAPEVPALQMPALVDTSGVFCRPEGVGFNYICGKNPTKRDILTTKNEVIEEVDYDFFYRDVWPHLVKRVPAFKNAKVINAWNMYEDANTFDEAPVFGEHLLHNNFYQMCGLAGYGSQLSIAAGKLVSEKYLDRTYVTTNVRKFDMRRIMQGTRYQEPLRCD
uniref:FAD-dependent oxidoreductase domain-containing protein 1 n=1 Tax=Ditylenchus dipsaci TaxID=166011 RepID=A0A915EPK4_9BILA